MIIITMTANQGELKVISFFSNPGGTIAVESKGMPGMWALLLLAASQVTH